jgi:glutamate-1-semialdehyde 2,1-aminomutase
MERFAGDVNHSGTFNSNVISMAASAAALAELERDEGAVYRHMEQIGQSLMEGIQEIAGRHGVPLLVQGLPTAFHLSFTELPAIKDYRDYALHCDKERYNRLVLAMLKRGVRLVGRGIWYISAAHTQDHVAQTLEALDAALQEA